MKKIIYLLTVLMFCSSCQETLEERCARETKEYTVKSCPISIDEFTIQDSLTYEKDTRTIHYYYTLCKDAETRTYDYRTKEIILNQLRNNTSINAYKDKGFNFAYTYRAQTTGKVLYDLCLTPKDYKFSPKHGKVGQGNSSPSSRNVSR